jgi:hypothetical protein
MARRCAHRSVRRSALLRVALLACACSVLFACSKATDNGTNLTAGAMTQDQKYWQHKFRGLVGGQLVLDAVSNLSYVSIYDEKGGLVDAPSLLSPSNGGTLSYGAEFGVPISIRVVRYAGENLRPTNPSGTYSGGSIVFDRTFPVAARIPDELLDDLRKNGGGFRLKLRIAADDVYIGWDIERRPGFDPGAKDAADTYHPPFFAMTGGDFKEARIRYHEQTKNGYELLKLGVREKGWYIDKKTGQKIETDF